MCPLVVAVGVIVSEIEGVTRTLALTLAGFGFSAYLTYRESFTIMGHPIYCEWCVGSASLRNPI